MDNKRMRDVFISYNSNDSGLAERICKQFESSGVSVWISPRDITAGKSYAESIASAIEMCKYFMPIVTDSYVKSAHCLNELDLVAYMSSNRQKTVMAVCQTMDTIRNDENIRYYLMRNQIRVVDFDDASAVESEIGKIAEQINKEKLENGQFDILSDYLRSGAYEQASLTLCDIIAAAMDELSYVHAYEIDIQKLMQLSKHCERLAELYEMPGCNTQTLTERKQALIMQFAHLTKPMALAAKHSTDVKSSVMTRLCRIFWEIQLSCDDVTGCTPPLQAFIELQEPFVAVYRLVTTSDGSPMLTDDPYADYIKGTLDYILTDKTVRKYHPTKQADSTAPSDISDEDDLLNRVAGFMREGNEILEIIGKNESAASFFRCLIMSYERLRAYCEAIGNTRACAECIDKIHELKSLADSADKASASDKAESSIKSLLGLTAPKTGKFDVFISHKSADYDIAKDMYDFLHRELKEAFFDSESLGQMSESQYRKSIMKALEASTHFVVVCSNLDYLESRWVATEMEIFQSEIDEGRKENSNFIMVFTDDVYDKVIASNKKLIPLEYRRCEIMRLSQYKDKILNYLK